MKAYGTKNKLYELNEILVILGVICGADNWTEIVAFGEAKLEFLRTLFPSMRHGEHEVRSKSPR